MVSESKTFIKENTLIRKELEIEGRKLIIEEGRMAKQANGAVTVRYGDTMILATAVSSEGSEESKGFLPLYVEYMEKAYAAGKIPGGFFKREGKPSEKEIISARLTDRSIRPLFKDGFNCKTQIIISVLSSDQENDANILGTIGASAALSISDIPFNGPIGSVRIGKIGDSFVINPRFSDLEKSSMDIIATGTEDSIIMIEGEAKEITEEDLIEALKLGHETIKLIVNIQKKVVEECGKPKIEPEVKEVEEELVKEVKEISFERIKKINRIPEKVKREGEIEALKEEVLSILEEKFPEKEQEIEAVLNDLFKKNLRSMIIGESVRIDRRRIEDIRPISCEVGILPRAHGSALFTRGETQSLAATTLGTKIDEQIIDGVDGEFSKSYMLHYNFPPFSVGEVRPIRGPGRREIGHGYLAERSLKAVIPDETVFPYTVRIVSDILESNGSSSMATVCAGSLSLMDAGVPVKRTVAGIAMGLIKENDKHIILTDIIGAEDYYGDMDFKIAGTREGVTAFQLDLKIPGISFDIIEKALRQAREGRMKIIDIMEQVIEKPRSELSTYAPRILTMKIPIELIGDVIGPGGKRIRNIIEETGSKIEIEDDGTILISSIGEEAGKKAREMIEKYIERPEVGSIYLGKVKKVTNFGAFVEILPGKEGLLHISEIQHQRVNKVEDILKPGDKIEVKIIKIDSSGKISLSRKALIEKPRGYRDYGYQPYIRKKIQRK